MQLDQNMVAKMLSLSDSELEMFLRQVGQENGIDLGGFQMSAKDAAEIRTALSALRPDDIARMRQMWNGQSPHPPTTRK